MNALGRINLTVLYMHVDRVTTMDTFPLYNMYKCGSNPYMGYVNFKDNLYSLASAAVIPAEC